MEQIVDALKISWLPTVLFFVLGIPITVAITKYYISDAKPSFHMQSLRLIAKENAQLPDAVQILFNGKEVPKLTKTRIVFWNAGRRTLLGKNIVEEDPLSISFSADSEILSASIVKASRETNKVNIQLVEGKINQAQIFMDYLDKDEGAVIELLHTANEEHPEFNGTIRGIPKGLRNTGYSSLPRGSTDNPKRKFRMYFLYAILLTGITMIASSPYFFFFYKPDKTPFSGKQQGSLFLVSGAVYAVMAAYLLISRRRRFPRSLLTDDD